MAFQRRSKTGTTVEQLKAEELYGILLKAKAEAAPLPDERLQRALWAAEDTYERDLNLLWNETRVFSNPTGRNVGSDASLRVPDFDEVRDLADAAYDYNARLWEEERWAHIQVDRGPIRSITRVIFTWPGAWKVWTVPPEWLQIEHRFRWFQIVPNSGPAVYMTFTSFILGVLSGGRGLPQSIVCDYVAGFTPDLLAARHQDLLEGVRLRALLSIMVSAGIIAMPNGATSLSLSLDGLSRSRSVGGKYGPYSGAIELALAREEQIRKSWHDHEVGPVFAIL